MRYPVGDGTKENFIKDWYVSDGFGSYRVVGNFAYYHSGVDLSMRGGSNLDLREPIKAVSSGRLVYFHKNSHPTRSYGLHNVYRIQGEWGVRWVHQSHCLPESFMAQVQDVDEGQMVARTGSTGNSTGPHIHFAIYRVDPATLRSGIDTVPVTPTELDNWFENPLVFINKYYGGSMPDDQWGDTVYKSEQHDKTSKYIWGDNVDARQKSGEDVINHIKGLENRIKDLEENNISPVPEVPSGWSVNGYQTTSFSDGKTSITTNYKKD